MPVTGGGEFKGHTGVLSDWLVRPPLRLNLGRAMLGITVCDVTNPVDQ